jgi:ribosome-binding factor A
MIAFELKDPRLEFVSVTRVSVTQDLRYARVYVSQLGDDIDKAEVISALEHAGGYLRYNLGQRIKLRFLPELSFLFDDGLIASQRMNQLLDELQAERQDENMVPEKTESSTSHNDSLESET